MKILYFVDGMNYKGGISRIVCDKVNYLADILKYEICLCTLNNNIESTYILSPNIRLISIPVIKKSNSLLGKICQIIHAIRFVKKTIISEKPHIIVNANAKIITWILPYIKKEIPKILEIHFSKEGMKLNILKHSKIFKWIYWYAIKFTYVKYQKFVVLTKEDKTYWSFKNCISIPNFTNLKNDNLPDLNEKTIICVARYQTQKRLDLLIEIWSKINKQCPEWHIEVYGKGPDESYLREIIRKKGLEKTFLLKGVTDNIRNAYQKGSIFVLTSEHEGFVLALLEAMEMGLPICSFDIIGVHGIIKNNYSGLLVPFGDTEKYSKELLRLINSPLLRKELRNNAYLEVKKYSRESIMKKWDTLFNDLVNNKQA